MFLKKMEKNKIYGIVSFFLAIVLIFSIISFLRQDKVGNESEEISGGGSFKNFAKLVKNMIDNRDEERTFMVLLQNNMELRPGGGFIGSFAIVKTQGEKVLSYEIHDTGNFDGRIPDTQSMPYPMKEIFNIDSWKLRDSNYSPDFKVNAEKALEFYYLGKGEEQFDGVIAINVSLLEKILEFTGPIKLEGFPDTFNSKNVLYTLEKQVEMEFWKQGIDRGERKQVLGALLKEILNKVKDLSLLDKTKLFRVLTGELDNKNIQINFKDQALQSIVRDSNWAGEVDRNWNRDYLMMVDANLGAYKSDYYVKRSADYEVDFSGEKPKVILKIKYNHTAKEENWFTRDYLTYLRIYVPKGTQLESFAGTKDVQTGEDFGKTYFGSISKVKTGAEQVVEIIYYLPENVTYEDYALKIQKQSGAGSVPVKVNIRSKDGQVRNFDMTMEKDIVLEK